MPLLRSSNHFFSPAATKMSPRWGCKPGKLSVKICRNKIRNNTVNLTLGIVVLGGFIFSAYYFFLKVIQIDKRKFRIPGCCIWALWILSAAKIFVSNLCQLSAISRIKKNKFLIKNSSFNSFQLIAEFMRLFIGVDNLLLFRFEMIVEIGKLFVDFVFNLHKITA